MDDLKAFLDAKVQLYEQADFIETDPIQIPKQFSRKEDIEISAFIASTLAWGQRPMIIKKAKQWMVAMDNQPYDFLMNAKDSDFKRFINITYRTIKSEDSLFFMYSLQNIYKNHKGLENVFSKHPNDIKKSIQNFRHIFMEIPHLGRSEKHIASPEKGSAAKRINMFLRWMVRPSENNVDFGIWKQIKPSALKIPLDTHSGRVARQLDLLQRKQNDWKSVDELTNKLLIFDSNDPVKYDYALFGIGVFE